MIQNLQIELTYPSSISNDWLVFQAQLDVVLKNLQPHQYLIFNDSQTDRCIQFAKDDIELRVECIGNNYLKGKSRLKKSDINIITNLGWNTPTGSHKSSTPERDPRGSPNYFSDFKLPINSEYITKLAIITFLSALKAVSPNTLRYSAFDNTGRVIELPALGLEQEEGLDA